MLQRGASAVSGSEACNALNPRAGAASEASNALDPRAEATSEASNGFGSLEQPVEEGLMGLAQGRTRRARDGRLEPRAHLFEVDQQPRESLQRCGVIGSKRTEHGLGSIRLHRSALVLRKVKGHSKWSNASSGGAGTGIATNASREPIPREDVVELLERCAQ